jgi:hypothetical protein
MSNSRSVPTWTDGGSNSKLPDSKLAMIPFYHWLVMVGGGSIAHAY